MVRLQLVAMVMRSMQQGLRCGEGRAAALLGGLGGAAVGARCHFFGELGLVQPGAGVGAEKVLRLGRHAAPVRGCSIAHDEPECVCCS